MVCLGSLLQLIAYGAQDTYLENLRFILHYIKRNIPDIITNSKFIDYEFSNIKF